MQWAWEEFLNSEHIILGLLVYVPQIHSLYLLGHQTKTVVWKEAMVAWVDLWSTACVYAVLEDRVHEHFLYLLGLGQEPKPLGCSWESHPAVSCLCLKDGCG